MEDFNTVLEPLAKLLGVETASVISLLIVVSIVARFIGKVIPDDRTGWLGIVRNICKVIGLYTSNRVTSGVSVAAVSKAILDSKMTARNDRGQLTTQTVEEAARELK